MSNPKAPSNTREHSHELVIEASPEEVWKAITDPEQLVAWFPAQAEVEAGKGGRIHYRWGDDWSIPCAIREWTPPRRLRTSWVEGNWSREKCAPLAVDWSLEGEGGRTRLRLVHSGFDASSDWDQEFDGTRRGWGFELLSLKHYLERHRGKGRQVCWVRQPTSLTAPEAWPRLVGAGGIIVVQGTPEVGAKAQVRVGNLDPVAGRILTHHEGRELSCLVDEWNSALLRVGWEPASSGIECQGWVALWDASPERIKTLSQEVRDSLARAAL